MTVGSHLGLREHQGVKSSTLLTELVRAQVNPPAFCTLQRIIGTEGAGFTASPGTEQTRALFASLPHVVLALAMLCG